ncbi:MULTISPECIES: DMT family transporter [unclassified Paenibacillus]|uniref:DMT family transporter n=1 Tax=unclassified Paenibacillus TaxID=185978 RepID=UPI000953D6C7|nr:MULTISPECIES: DMT family transporter [unclassified Paenibacillus]ASS65475.1 DMT family transporter [Paenibacillus sp. RUD330]SIQ34915.1 transporter family-2 protein [Paenibacillus sp. RU4X]SIQ56756.1 transporter family-2 protein [Paenibacillus sp. RU4T]
MKGILFAAAAGMFITLQGVANSRIGAAIGTWQAAALTQLTGFIAALLLLGLFRRSAGTGLRGVKPLYLTGGAMGAVIVFSNVQAIHAIGITITVAVLLIAQLSLTFLIDGRGWFGVVKQTMSLPQFLGIAMMIAGVLILRV